jgi:hypothetical protein
VNYDCMERALQVCQQMGIKWSHEEFGWADVQPRRGEFVWDRLDRAVTPTLAHGISIMGVVAYWAGH